MGHKTLIGGTAYEISGGKTLVGGTAYKIDKGKTLVGGTAYKIAFSSLVTVTITGEGDEDCCYAYINGEYYTSESELALDSGTVVYLRASGKYNSSQNSQAAITLNGSTVSKGSFSEIASYDLKLTGYTNVTIELSVSMAGRIAITAS